jgi:dCTP deaminase
MPLLSYQEIKQAIAEGNIVIQPALLEDNIAPASVDLSLGEEAFRATDEQIQKLEAGQFLRLEPGDITLVITRESIELNPSIAGQIGLRSYFTRKGLALLAGPQIDPGFRGKLHLVLVNLSPSENVIGYGEPFCTVEFHRLSVPTTKPYNRPFQGPITQGEVEDIRRGRGYALSEVIKDMQTIARDIGELKNVVKTHSEKIDNYVTNANRNMNIFITTIVALALAAIGALITIAVKFLVK